MASTQPSVIVPCLLSVILALCLHTTYVSAICQIDPAEDVFLNLEEELPVGSTLYNFNVDPPDSSFTLKCETDTFPSEICEYIWLNKTTNSIVLIKRMDIESFDYNSLRENADGFIYYDIFGSTYVTCRDPDDDIPFSVIINARVNNVNEEMVLAPNFTTTVAELALGGTNLVFENDIITEDQDVTLMNQQDGKDFNCTLLEEDQPFFVSSCVTDYNELTTFAFNTARIQVKPPPPTLDYELKNYYEITLRITDKKDIYNTTNMVDTKLFITIADLDDQDPLFDYTSYSAVVSEGITADLNIEPADIFAVDQDTLNDRILYEFEFIEGESPACQDQLFINQDTAGVRVIQEFDREVLDVCEVIVKAYQTFNPVRFSTAPLTINITDVNDNCPEFDEPSYTGIITVEDLFVMINETQERLLVTATDADVDLEFNGKVTFNFLGDAADVFEVVDEPIPGSNSRQMYIKLANPAQLNNTKTYTIEAEITDTSITCQSKWATYLATIEIHPVDLRPRFDQPAYFASINEGEKYGTEVTMVSARTWDNKNEGIMYLLDRATNDGDLVFELNDETGVIIVISEQTDATKIPEYVLFIHAEDRRSQPTRTVSTAVSIFVNDTNNNCPEFNKAAYFGEISASDVYAVEAGTLSQLFITATDNDTAIAYTDVYISSGNPNDIFQLEHSPTFNPQSHQWSVKLVDPFLLQDGETYNLMVTRIDSPLCSPEVVDLTIKAADLSPVFDLNEYLASMDERADVGTRVVQVIAYSYDNKNDSIFYSLKSGNNKALGIFTIDRTTGWITVIDGMTDAETVGAFTMVVVAEDRETQPPRTASTTVIITLNNLNDECPDFNEERYTGTITPQDKYVVRNDGTLNRLVLTTVDADMEYNGYIDQLPESDDIFGIETALVADGSAKEVYITLEDPTRLGVNFYTVLVQVTDNSTIAKVPPCPLVVANVSVVISADLSPVFEAPAGGFIGYLEENSPSNTFIIQVAATTHDGRPSPLIKYQLKDGQGLFQIDRDTGDISTLPGDFDYETTQEYTLVVEAQDRSTEPFRTSSVTVLIMVNNTNDECPEFEEPTYTGQISLQDLYVTDKLTLEKLILVATDADMTFIGNVTLLSTPGSGIFALDEDRTIIGQSRVSIRLLDDDLLTEKSYNLQIQASDLSAVGGVDCSNLTPIDVLVEVISDFAPNFTEPEYSANITENSLKDQFVVQVKAESQGVNPDIVYIIKSVSNNGARFFTIDRSTGIITLAADGIDYEGVTLYYTIVVEAQDRGVEPFRSATTAVFVYLEDENDIPPVFEQISYAGEITTQDLYVVTGSGSTERLVITAFDGDTKFMGTFRLEPGPGDDIFDIVVNEATNDAREVEVYIELLDPELLVVQPYVLEIRTTDAGFSDITQVTVQVVQDLAPTFDESEYFGEIQEGDVIGTPVVQVNATSQNAGTSEILYSLKSGSNGGLLVFEIDKNTGQVRVKSTDTDYENIQEYTLVVEAQDRGTEPPRSATTVVIITITDANDRCPEFDELNYFGQITTEDVYVVHQGAVEYLVVRASDEDSTFEGTAEIKSDESGGSFDIVALMANELRINLTDSSGIQDGFTYNMVLSMNDPSIGCTPSETNVTIKVEDLSPSFSQQEYTGSVPENSPDDTPVLQVSATNKDGNTQGIVYSITWATGDGVTYFRIDSGSGVIFAGSGLDADTTSEYTLSVTAQDIRFEPPRSASATVTITIGDENDLCPYFESPFYDGIMSPEDSFVLNSAGEERLRLIGVDKDISGFLGVASIFEDPTGGAFDVEDSSTTGEWYLKVVDPARIELGVHIVSVGVGERGDSPCDNNITDVSITVTDELVPKFGKDMYNASVPEGTLPGYRVVRVAATDKDGNNDTIIYRIISASNRGDEYFQVDPITGWITVIRADIDAEMNTEFALFIEAIDTGLEPQRTGTTTVTIKVGDINDSCPKFEIAYYVGSMSEEDNYVLLTDGTDRLVLRAIDADSSGFSGTAAITDDSTGGAFDISPRPDPGMWNIRVGNASLIELGIHSLRVAVTDGTTIGISCGLDITNVTITVTDELTPRFGKDVYDCNVTESADPGAPVTRVEAINKDGNNEGIVYRIKSGSNQATKYFQINVNTGEITVKAEGIDAEMVLEFVLFVEATDTRLEPQRSGITTVVVQVVDINDQCLLFDNDIYTGTLQQGESWVLGANGRLVISVMDGDQTFSGNVSKTTDSSGDAFELIPVPDSTAENVMEYFVITTDPTLPVDVYSIGLMAWDDTSVADPLCPVEAANITITVVPAGQLPPSFGNNTYRGSCPEGASVNTLIVKVEAFNDEGTSDNILYILKSASNGGENLFYVDSDDGEVRVKSDNIDRESVAEYTLFIEARDETITPVLSDTTTVIVTILDVNDNAPVFQEPEYNATLPENAQIGFVVITVTATDMDEDPSTTYAITSPPGAPFVILDPAEGVITLSGSLDTDPPTGIGSYTIEITAYDAEDPSKSDTTILVVMVTDVNDNSPVFEDDTYEISMEENSITPVSTTVSATDADDGDGGMIMYYLQSPTDKNIMVDQNTGEVTFNGPYDRELESEIVAIIEASDSGQPPLSSTTRVILTITDVNDNNPEFTKNGCGDTVQIPEDFQIDLEVCKVLATDEDEMGTPGAMISYSLTGSDAGFFRIEKDINGYGVVRLNKEVDRELQDIYEITIVASDEGSPSRSANLNVIVQVTDVNDEPPEFTMQTEYRKSFTDDVPSGTEIISVTATDKDSDPFKTVLCNITSSDGSHEFFFVNSDGVVCTVSTQTNLPVQQSGPYVITIQAYNPDQPDLVGNSLATVSVYVTRDTCFVIIDPTDYYTKVQVGDINAGEEVVKVMATSPCGVDGLVYNITRQTLTPTPIDGTIPSMEFTIDSETGVVSALMDNPSLGTHYLEVSAYNVSNPEASMDVGYVTMIIIPNTNDNPAFDSNLCSAMVQVPKLADYVVINLEYNVTDPDYPLTGVGEVVFTELSETRDTGEATNYFVISETGLVTLGNNLLEVPEALTINMTVQVADKGLPPATDVASIIISIEPAASNPPEFINKCPGIQYVDENEPMPYFLCQVSAEGSSTIAYSVDDESIPYFNIGGNDGWIYTNKEFDYENPAERQFKVLVSATSISDGLTATISVNVVVRDENDRGPVFDQPLYEFSILEDVASGGCAGKAVGTVRATDADSDPDYAYLEYRITGEPYDFTINAVSGEIETTECIDLESPDYQSGVVSIVVIAANVRVNPVLATETTVQISIGDQNDNSPVFQQDPYSVILPSLPPSTELITVKATDVDQGENQEIYYVIAQDQQGIIYEYFTVDRVTGLVSTTPTAELPPGEGLEAVIIVEAWDNGSPPRNDRAEVILSVQPGYEDGPVFRERDQNQGMAFKENMPIRAECFNFTAPLHDEALVLVYSVVNDTSAGQINLRCSQEPILCNMAILDREESDSFVMVIEANSCDPSETDCGSCETGQTVGQRVSRKVDQNAEEMCLQPIATGPCEALIPRWAYDSDQELCVQFTYGGCEGNENNFMTKEECQQKCEAGEMCLQPIETGPCDAVIPRWAYDSDQELCVQFTYGGCEGNENNFMTKEECQQKCEAGAGPVAVEANQMVVEIIVTDMNDEAPQATGFITGLPNKYYIGIADNLAYNSTIFKVTATDADLDSLLVYDLAVYERPEPQNKVSSQDIIPHQDTICTGLPFLELNNWGNLQAKDAVYSYLDVDKTDIGIEQVSCEYVVTVTDENTDPLYEDTRKSRSIPTKIKVLYSFEHAIIVLDTRPELIVDEADQIAQCFSSGMRDYILKVEFVRGQFIDEQNGFTIVNPERTDLWVYAVNDKTGEFAKYWDIKSAWDENPIKDNCGIAILNGADPYMRPAHVRKDYLYPYASYVGWAVLALACFIALATLICIYVIYDSWDKMVMERTRFMTAVMTGRDNYGYTRYVDAGVVTDPWDMPMQLEDRMEKPQLFESQEMTMDMFAETPLIDKKKLFESQEMTMDLFAEYYEDKPGDEAALAMIRMQSSPTEVSTVIVTQEDLKDNDDIFTITKETSTKDTTTTYIYETTTSYEVVDVPIDGDKDKDDLQDKADLKKKDKKALKDKDKVKKKDKDKGLSKIKTDQKVSTPKNQDDEPKSPVKNMISKFNSDATDSSQQQSGAEIEVVIYEKSKTSKEVVVEAGSKKTDKKSPIPST